MDEKGARECLGSPSRPRYVEAGSSPQRLAEEASERFLFFFLFSVRVYFLPPIVGMSDEWMSKLVEHGNDGPFLRLMDFLDFMVDCYGLREEKIVYCRVGLDGTRAGIAVFNVGIVHPKLNPNSLKHQHTCMVYYGSDDQASINSKVIPAMDQLLNLWGNGDKRDNRIVTWNSVKYSFSFLNDLKCHWDFFDFPSKHCYKHEWGKSDQETEVDLEKLYETEGREVTISLKKKGKNKDGVVIHGKVEEVEVEDDVFKFIVAWKGDVETLKGCLTIPVWMIRIDFLLHGRKRVVSGIFSYEWRRILNMNDKKEKERLLVAGNNAMSIALGRAWRYDQCMDSHTNRFDLKCESGEGFFFFFFFFFQVSFSFFCRKSDFSQQ